MIKVDKEKGLVTIPFYIVKGVDTRGWSDAIYNAINNEAFSVLLEHNKDTETYRMGFKYISSYGFSFDPSEVVEKKFFDLTLSIEPVALNPNHVHFKLDEKSTQLLKEIFVEVRKSNLKLDAERQFLALGLTKEGEFNDTIL